MANPTPDFDDLISTIRSTTANNEQKTVAAATIALRLVRSQSQYDLTSLGANFPTLVTQIKTSISGL